MLDALGARERRRYMRMRLKTSAITLSTGVLSPIAFARSAAPSHASTINAAAASAVLW
ncbi:MAG TPA: hypothetical protein VN888_12525 [Mycobacterium sp.]|jgi:hypothetical protein|nr:hypothetical protein [Mycobacterium sp.]